MPRVASQAVVNGRIPGQLPFTIVSGAWLFTMRRELGALFSN
jgi:hypothetical protein